MNASTPFLGWAGHAGQTCQRWNRQPLPGTVRLRSAIIIGAFAADACHFRIYSCRFCSTRSTTTQGAVHIVAESGLHAAHLDGSRIMSEMPNRSTNARPSTRADVARYAGVSTAVVSYVVNDGPRRVARRRLRGYARRSTILNIGRTPTPGRLKKGSTDMLGVVLPDITNPFFAEYARALEVAAAAYGYVSSSPTQTQTRITRAGSSVTSPTGMWMVSSSAPPSHPRLSVR